MLKHNSKIVVKKSLPLKKLMKLEKFGHVESYLGILFLKLCWYLSAINHQN